VVREPASVRAATAFAFGVAPSCPSRGRTTRTSPCAEVEKEGPVLAAEVLDQPLAQTSRLMQVVDGGAGLVEVEEASAR